MRRAEKIANKRMEQIFDGGYVVFEDLDISLDKEFHDYVTVRGRGGYVRSEEECVQVRFTYDVDLKITRTAAEIAARVVEYIYCELDDIELIREEEN